MNLSEEFSHSTPGYIWISNNIIQIKIDIIIIIFRTFMRYRYDLTRDFYGEAIPLKTGLSTT